MKNILMQCLYFFLFANIFFMSGCSNTKHLPAGETLFTGSKIKFKDNEISKKEKKTLMPYLATVIRPKPNTKLFGIRLKLLFYNMAGDTKKKKGLRPWLRNKLGEPPILTSSVNLGINKDLVLNSLQNRGFFRATETARIDTSGKKKAIALFEVTTGPQYKINKSIFIKIDSTEITFDIDSSFFETLLIPGASYNLDIVKAERNRIDRVLKESGFFYFRPEYILLVADTSIGDHKMNMYVQLKDKDIPDEAFNVYKINNIYLYANYKLMGMGKDTSKENKFILDKYIVIDNKKAFKPFVFADAMVFEKGDEYSLDDQNLSLSRLVNLGTFKFVKNRFEDIGNNQLDVYYYLTPYPKKALRFEAGVLTQNDNRLGTQGSVSWRNRNAFGGAEELVFKITGGFEAQSTGRIPQPGIFSVGAETDLSFPRFVVPFVNVQTISRYLPRSIIKLKYNFETETNRLSIKSYSASYGYDWKPGSHKEHQFYPINFTYVHTDTLGKSGDLNLIYRNLVFNGIILGPTYEYTYNSPVGSRNKSGYFFDGLVDMSGNVMGLAESADFKKNPKELFGVTYAQYIKLQPDFRYYLHLSNAAILASRILVGIGIPNGNSNQLPNIKQFWAGGNSDLRGFPSRLVGPGIFNEYSRFQSKQYIETLGDLKLEINTELRRNIYKFIKLGVFAEAGNIWLYRKNATFQGGEFTSDFYKQLAADIGIGIRFDFKILLLRLDFGFPVLKPWLPDYNGFDLNHDSLKDIVFNLAIGYPF